MRYSIIHDMSKKSFEVSVILAILVCAIFVWFLAHVELSDVWRQFRNSDSTFLGTAFGLYIMSGVLKAVRFKYLLRTDRHWTEWFRLSSLQNALNVFLPLRAGEWYYLAALKTESQVTIATSLSVLVAVRLIDAAVVLLIFFAALSMSILMTAPTALVYVTLATFTVCGGLVLLLIFGNSILMRTVRWLRSTAGIARLDRLFLIVEQLLMGFVALRERHILLRAIVLTLCIWATTFLSAYALLSALGLVVSFPQSVIIYGFPTMISMTPAFMFGGIGTYEASIVLPLVWFGVTREVAIATALVAHVYELSFLVITLIVALVLHFLSQKYWYTMR